MLKLENVTKVFENHKNKTFVLNGISMEVHQGDMIGIMGPSGSGKSTLLRIVGCLDYPTEGEYLIDGKSQKTLNERELAYMRNAKFGFILQDFALIEDESVLENVMVPVLFRKQKMRGVEEEIEKILEYLHIGHLIDKKVYTLSGGEKQRVAIARALINKPDIILADEPTGALDLENTIQIMELLKELNQSGITIVLITHDETVAQYCGIRYDLKEGKLYRI